MQDDIPIFDCLIGANVEVECKRNMNFEKKVEETCKAVNEKKSLRITLAFIIYGFFSCKIYKVKDTFIWSAIFFGGLGQITCEFLEYCKGGTFPCTRILLTFSLCLLCNTTIF